MKKVIVFFTCIVFLLIVSGCSQPQSAQAQPASPTPSPLKTAALPTTAPPVTAWTPQSTTPTVSDNTITIRNLEFTPSSITVKKGAIVRWVNYDSMVHTITFTKASGINPSDPLSASQSFSVKFDETGTYPYSCGIHPSMKGAVIVE